MTPLSHAARHFQESAIRRTGILGAAVPGLISLAAGYPSPDVFPWDDLQSITAELLARRDGNTLQYGATRGYRPLIEQLLAKTLRGRGISGTFEDVVITTGSQQGLDLAGRVLIDPGDVVLVELPTYSGAIAAFHNLQGQFAGVPQDAEGMDLAALESAIAGVKAKGQRAKFIYVTPNFQNPAGLLMSRARRLALLEQARRHDLVILEDDPYGSIFFEDTTTAADTRPIKADDTDGRVVYLGSFSKVLVPGLRLAWMVAPRAIAEKVELAKQAADICSSVFDQRIVHAAMDRGVVDRIAPRLARALPGQTHGDGAGTAGHPRRPCQVDLSARRLLPVDRVAGRRRRPGVVRAGTETQGELRPRQRVLRRRPGPPVRATVVLGHQPWGDYRGHWAARPGDLISHRGHRGILLIQAHGSSRALEL